MSESALIDHAELTDFVTAIFQAEGMSQPDARCVAGILVWAELRVVESHGIERVPRYASLMKSGQMEASATPVLQEIAPAAVRIDGQKAMGPVAMMMALEACEPRARTCGIAMGIVNNSTHTGAIGYYAEWAAKRGFAAIVMAGGMPLMAWPGTKVASISTSPVAIGVPGGPDGELVFDMATAIAGSGKLAKAKADKKPLPEGWALDAEGNPATDPDKAVTSLPVGGPKGAGLSLMLEILCGVLGGTPIVGPMSQPGAPRPHSANGLVILIDIAKFRPVGDFSADVDLVANAIKGLPRFADAEPVRMPGERGNAQLRARKEKGIPVNARLAASLAKMAAERKVAIPAAFATGG